MSVRALVIAAGGANYGSLREACRRLGVETELSDDPARVAAATHVILPGVGAAAPAMDALRARGLDRALRELGRPLLGICLGMQLLYERSAEGDVAGLGLLRGCVRRLPAAPRWPHMGWTTLAPRSADHPLLRGIGRDDWFYFVHGYAADDGDATLAAAEHGARFAAVVARGNVHGAQFHPEKSAAAGRRLLANFFGL
ncbi:MAG: imidazole glycerol phosphate synthase subunit HisH [Dokdonella sp.]|uniref:imidazole glycerol phosphate synthase subunit HisH n=1 Tax=Dokdonella sp. TaxID=2291710 RepID=UPI003F7EDB9D